MKYTGEEYCEDSQNFEIKIFENSIPVEIDFFERKIIFCNERVWTGIKIKSFEETMELIKKDRKQITKDWLSFFMGFSEYKPMHLIRRNGAFLCGIHLQTHSGNWDYEMIFHIYNLMVDFPVISLSSDTFLLNHKGARDSVSLSQHKESFSNYAERLKQQVPLLHKDIVNCDELVTYIKTTINNSIGYPAESFRDIVLALFWCGKINESEKEIADAKKIISRWDNAATQRFGGVSGWEKQVRELMNIDILNSTMEKQLQKFKLTNYYDYQLLCSSKY
jgi:hypothetical protein